MFRVSRPDLKVGRVFSKSFSTPGPKNFLSHTSDRRVARDRGARTENDFGSGFTERASYESKSLGMDDDAVLSRQLASDRSIKSKIQQDREAALRGGAVGPHVRDPLEMDSLPRNSAEKRRSDYYNARDIGLVDLAIQGTSEELASSPDHLDVTKKMLLQSKANADIYRAMEKNMPLEPANEGEARKLRKSLRGMNSMDDRVLELQNKLAEEDGVFSPQRMKAYMLSDESIFPNWVDGPEVPEGLRNAVKYGNLGLSDQDAVTRLRLAKLPADERVAEWERIAEARRYKMGKERPLTATEKEQLKRNKRQNYWLVNKRQERANTLKRLVLAKPDQYEAFPSGAVDYSARLALIAKHVQAGVETKGKWPLSEGELQKAMHRKKREDASLVFSREGARRELNIGRMDPQIASALDALERDKTPRVIKRVSIAKYHNRWRAVRDGQEDEHGRNFQQFRTARKLMKHNPFQAPKSADQLALQKELHTAGPATDSNNEIFRSSRKMRSSHGWNPSWDKMAFGGNKGGSFATSGVGRTQFAMHNPYVEE